jgi:glycosyltransferase involved in cell wall biosynthesis
MEPIGLLFFVPSLSGGGAERVTANLANYWAGKGWKIAIVTLSPMGQDAYALDPAITRISLNMLSPSKNLAHGLLQNLNRVRRLRKVLLGIRPEVAVAAMDVSSATLALAARGLTNTVPVGRLQIHPPCESKKAVWKGIESMAYGQLSALTALTRQTAAWLAANTNAKRIEVIPNPIQLPLPENGQRIEPESLCKPGRNLLLAAGRLAPQKGFDLLIEAFGKLSERHPNWDLAIVGQGPERSRLEMEISESGLKQRVLLPGWAGNVADWYGRADLYVMSSRYEGFPNALAEAMAHGLPAVSFDCDTGPKDIIRDGTDGFLVPKEDAGALVAALDRLMGDADLRTQFKGAAIEIRDRYSIHRVAQMWECLFEELLARRGRVLAAA